MSSLCPQCGGVVEVPTVDIGVGEQQYAPAFCTECDWSESYPEWFIDGPANDFDFGDCK